MSANARLMNSTGTSTRLPFRVGADGSETRRPRNRDERLIRRQQNRLALVADRHGAERLVARRSAETPTRDRRGGRVPDRSAMVSGTVRRPSLDRMVSAGGAGDCPPTGSTANRNSTANVAVARREEEKRNNVNDGSRCRDPPLYLRPDRLGLVLLPSAPAIG